MPFISLLDLISSRLLYSSFFYAQGGESYKLIDGGPYLTELNSPYLFLVMGSNIVARPGSHILGSVGALIHSQIRGPILLMKGPRSQGPRVSTINKKS